MLARRVFPLALCLQVGVFCLTVGLEALLPGPTGFGVNLSLGRRLFLESSACPPAIGVFRLSVGSGSWGLPLVRRLLGSVFRLPIGSWGRPRACRLLRPFYYPSALKVFRLSVGSRGLPLVRWPCGDFRMSVGSRGFPACPAALGVGLPLAVGSRGVPLVRRLLGSSACRSSCGIFCLSLGF